MLKYIKKAEKTIISSLLLMMTFVLLFSTIELAITIIRQIMSPPIFLLDLNKLLELLGLFLLVLIGIEVLETIKTQETYVVGHTIRVEVVLIVALIAIARKVIILDIKDFLGITLIGVGAVIVALSVGYYLVKRGDSESKSNIPLEPGTKK